MASFLNSLQSYFVLRIPSSEKKEILPFLDYFSVRTGMFVDIYCAGYRNDLKPEESLDERSITTVSGEKWWFDVQPFDSIRRDLETRTKWTYSGETDLILLTSHRSLLADECLSFANSLACNLEQMVTDKAISSVRAFVEQLSRVGEKYEGTDPVGYLSDRQGLKIGMNALKEVVLAWFPEGVRKEYRKAEHFALRGIEL